MNNIDEYLVNIDRFISYNNSKIPVIQSMIQQILKLNKKNKLSYLKYNTLYTSIDNNFIDFKEQEKTYMILRAKIQKKYEDLLNKRASAKSLLHDYENVLSRLEILYQSQLDLGKLLYEAKSYVNSFYLSLSQNSLQGLAAAAIPQECIKKLSPKSRKTVKIIKQYTENVNIPNESLNSTPETSPDTPPNK
jgi:hypothetical protein